MTESSQISTGFTSPVRKIPLRVVLTVPFVAILIVTVMLTSYLSFQSSESTIHTMAEQLLQEIDSRIELRLDSFLETPHLVNRANANEITMGLLDVMDADALRRYFWEKVQIYDSVTSIYFGNADGGLVLGGREGADGSLYVIVTDNFESGPFNKYTTDEHGNPDELIGTFPDFDARERPWYIEAVEHEGASWSEPYVLFTRQGMALASSLPVYDDDGKLLGVLSIDIFISHIGSFLQSLEIGQSGTAYIVEKSGLVVASSTLGSPFTGEGVRLRAEDIEDYRISESADYISEMFGGFALIDGQQQLVFEGEDGQQYLLISPFTDERGLDWLIVIVIPEDDFMGKIKGQNRTTLLLTILGVTIAILVGIVTAYRVSKPIVRLNSAAESLTQGDWSKRVSPQGVQEVHQLGQSFNKMADQLYGAFGYLEELVGQRTSELTRANVELQQLGQMKDEFVSNVTHELKAPITSLRLRHYMIGKQPDRADYHLSVTNREMDRLEELIGNLLILSRLDQGYLEFNFGVFDLSLLTGEYVVDRFLLAEEKELTLTHKPLDNAPAVAADRALIGQVLSILLTNSLNYTPAGGWITIGVETKEDDGVRMAGFSVADSGPGISAKDRGVLFTRFFRGEAGSASKVAGTGLGLAIAKAIVDEHHGVIDVESDGVPGKGTTFKVWLPVAKNIK
jgi:signal transduction histidine kinase